MRLLNTQSLQLQEFFEKDVPPYAILSHRWGVGEILYQDMIQTAEQGKTRRKRGYGKLKGSCDLARRQNYKWIWIDTCCIDKSSSAELTEAINSMYQWYEAAQVCYVYLDDVERLETFTESKWFTRGWTLQELIAPSTVEFYSVRWECLGTKRSLVRTIAAKSQVDVQVLMGGDPLEMSVARRMYWASHRVTTRVEDEAYCLLGLFGVNMPLIYGEGRKAFRRLQEEIIRLSNDQSILAWYPTGERDGAALDFLASSASDFQESGDISAHPYSRTEQDAMIITSQGLSLELVILSSSRDISSATESGHLFDEVDAILDCQMGSIPGTFASIRLKRQPKGGRPGRRKNYYRITGISSGFQSRFSAHSHQFESCDPAFLRDDTTLVTGLDPTQLDQEVYKEILDQSCDHTPWQQEQMIISRPQRDTPGYRSTSDASRNTGNSFPWSLLLATPQECDQRSFWFVFYCEPVLQSTRMSIEDVYPPERFDHASRQLRTTPIPHKYYNLHRFKIIDGVIVVSRLYRCHDGRGQICKAWGNLLVGREASSRRQNPTPWCQFAEPFWVETLNKQGRQPRMKFDKSSPAEVLYERFISQNETDLPAAAGPTTTSHPLTSGVRLNASVKEKEIAGTVYNLVVVEQVFDLPGHPTAIVLQRDDPQDYSAESMALAFDRVTELLMD